MKDKLVKILTHNNQFVDIALIHKGIYSTSVPHNYSLNTTIESLVDNWVRFFSGDKDDDVVTNLKQCELKTFKLIEHVN